MQEKEPVTNDKGVMSWTGTKWEYLGENNGWGYKIN